MKRTRPAGRSGRRSTNWPELRFHVHACVHRGRIGPDRRQLAKSLECRAPPGLSRHADAVRRDDLQAYQVIPGDPCAPRPLGKKPSTGVMRWSTWPAMAFSPSSRNIEVKHEFAIAGCLATRKPDPRRSKTPRRPKVFVQGSAIELYGALQTKAHRVHPATISSRSSAESANVSFDRVDGSSRAIVRTKSSAPGGRRPRDHDPIFKLSGPGAFLDR